MKNSDSRRTLFRWAGWFALANALVFGLVSLRYFSGGIPAITPLSAIYLVAVYIGHHVLLTVVPLFLLATPVILLVPRRRVVTVLGIVLFALLLALMMLDSLLWSQSRFHINALTLKILGWQSWFFAGFIFLIGLFFESMLARSTWNFVLAQKPRRGRLIGTFCALMIVVSQLIHAWADAAYYVPVTGLGQVLPVYKGVTAKSLLTRAGLVDVEDSRERELARRVSAGLDDGADRLLDYPKSPLQCREQAPLNLLMIVVDSMRGSMLTPEYAPEMSRFADRMGITYRNHFSGGNSSRMGMFSLFYGLPPGYWSTFSSLQRAPVLMDELQARGYQLGLYSSNTLYRPVVLDRTAFANVPNLRIVTEPASDPAWKRDRTLTREWYDWLERRDPERPFFGFLFYDTAMSAGPPPDYPVRWPPADDSPQQRNLAKYRSAVHYVDAIVGEVLADMERRGLLDDTVVMITSDHGEEFGESSAKLEGHGSGYTQYQLVIPMVLAWPGRERGVAYDHRTSHYDVAPTLVQDFLGCSNPAADYSVGQNLFEGKAWEWMVAGSYFNYAVLEPDQVTVTFPNGLYEVRDWDYRLREAPVFRGEVLEAVSAQNARFFRD
jgi:membrane-anchored protein YejM (alkaline phosphatase superfamily)